MAGHKDVLLGKSVGQLLVEGFSELASEVKAGGSIQGKLTCHKMTLDLQPQPYTASDVLKARRLLGVSQKLFAIFLGYSVKAVRAWEQGVNFPPVSACRMMDEIRFNPTYWKGRINDLIKPKHPAKMS